jgi:hypothetical protein
MEAGKRRRQPREELKKRRQGSSALNIRFQLPFTQQNFYFVEFHIWN